MLLTASGRHVSTRLRLGSTCSNARPLGRRQTIASARARRDAAPDAPDNEQQQEVPSSQQEVVRSHRSSSISQRRSKRTSGAAVVTPAQALRDVGIVAVDEEGKQFVDVSCMGRNKPAWYAVGVLEGKEAKYLDLLSGVLQEYGYTCSWAEGQQYLPPTAAAGGEVLGGDAASVAAAEAVLEEFDVVPWVPSKVAQVYSHNTDKLVERAIHYARGSGGGCLMLHMKLDPALVEAVEGTYYYMTWRDTQKVTGVHLRTAGLLPAGESKSSVYTLPLPCDAVFVNQLLEWQTTYETEDLQQKREEFYGRGGGTTFGEPEQYDRDRKNLDRDEAGNIIYREDYAGTFTNPNRWSEGVNSSSGSGRRGGRQQQQQRGGRGGRSSSRDNRRDSWSQQPQQQQRGGWLDAQVEAAGNLMPWEQEQQQQQSAAAARAAAGQAAGNDTRLQQMNFMEEMGSDRYGSDEDDWEITAADAASGPKSPRAGGNRDDGYNRNRQMDWMAEMGSGRYGGRGNISSWDQPPRQKQQQQQRQQQQGRQQQGRQQRQQPQEADVDWSTSGSDTDDKWWDGTAAAAGGRSSEGDGSFKNRMRQMAFMEAMGSARYGSDDDEKDDFDVSFGLGDERQAFTAGDGPLLPSSATADTAAGGGRDGGYNRHRQMDWMSEMGSGRYRAGPPSSSQKPSSGGRGSSSDSGSKRGMMSDVAAAFDDMFASSAGGHQQQQQQQQSKSASDGLQFSSSSDSDDGAAAARQMHDQWQQEGEGDGWPGYGPPGNRSAENMGASFEFDFEMGGLTSLSTDGSLPDISELDLDLSFQQQQQQQQSAPAAAAGAADGNEQRMKSRRPAAADPGGGGNHHHHQQQQQQRGRTGGAAAAAAAGGRKTKNSSAGRQRGAVVAADGGDAPAGFVGGSSGDLDVADGFEAGWADRLMADYGSDQPGLDDVMTDFGDDGDVTSSRRRRSR